LKGEGGPAWIKWLLIEIEKAKIQTAVETALSSSPPIESSEKVTD